MRRIRTARAMRVWTEERHAAGDRIGFVPTMGALHEGHLSLIRAARRSTGAVAVSIFVNPLQFGSSEDLVRYPRALAYDLGLCRKERVDVVFTPKVGELYPPGFGTTVTVNQLTRRFEGLSRPGHFEGVATVVTKLFNIVRPDRAFFGLKDYQQVIMIRRLVKDLDLDTVISVCPTVREADGLALSSRNRFLSLPERRAATILYRALSAGRALIQRGERSARKVRQAMVRLIRSEPLSQLDYAAVADPDMLEEFHVVRGRAVLLLAVRIGKIRLIDNMVVTCH
jgi:pantoate--beta-alanine ligase